MWRHLGVETLGQTGQIVLHPRAHLPQQGGILLAEPEVALHSLDKALRAGNPLFACLCGKIINSYTKRKGAALKASDSCVHWQLKAVFPVATVLLAGVLVFVWVPLSYAEPARHTVILVAAGGAVAICAVMLAALALLIQRPLGELREKIARLQRGELDVSVSFADRNDEIGDLGRHFNEMVAQLRANREEIQRLHHTQMSRAEHLATLGELAAGLAHEIRNPLAGIAGVMEIVGRELPETSPSREVLKEVQQEVLQIKKILSDLLDYARPREPESRPGDLNEVAERAVTLARQQALTRPIEIELVRAEGLAPVEHDATQIQQVLLNVLLNAIQAIKNSGQIRVVVGARDTMATVTVADTGHGIAPENLAKVFRPFFTTKGHGTGLGLSLARGTVEAHGGRIEVASELGKGSEFTVWLPFHKNRAEIPAGK